jgi:hypothetical protein
LIGVDYGNQTGKLLERIFTFYQPDLVLDFTQGTGRFIYSGLERSDMMHTPVVRCVSDFEGRGAHSWIEHKDQYIMCGTSCCRQQVRRARKDQPRCITSHHIAKVSRAQL